MTALKNRSYVSDVMFKTAASGVRSEQQLKEKQIHHFNSNLFGRQGFSKNL